MVQWRVTGDWLVLLHTLLWTNVDLTFSFLSARALLRRAEISAEVAYTSRAGLLCTSLGACGKKKVLWKQA